jgi:hypothetical protein
MAMIVEHPHIELTSKSKLVNLFLVVKVTDVSLGVGGVGGTEGWVERETRCSAVVGCPRATYRAGGEDALAGGDAAKGLKFRGIDVSTKNMSSHTFKC